MNRWSGIQHDVNLFCGCVTRIQDRNRSGSRVDDKVYTLFQLYDHLSQFIYLMFILFSNLQIAEACALFKSEDRNNRKFTLMHCWNILKDKPKWMERRKEITCAKKTSNKKQKATAISSPASGEPAAPDAGGSDAQPSGRLDGKKKEKKKLRQGRTIEAVEFLMEKKKEADRERELKKDERCNKAFALQEERLKLEREKFEFHRKLEEDKIIYMDLSTMTFDDQQYFEDRKREIRERHFNN